MKALENLTDDQLRQKISELESALSGLAALSYGVVPEEDFRELEQLRAELTRRHAAKEDGS
jgi:hypothetical protein